MRGRRNRRDNAEHKVTNRLGGIILLPSGSTRLRLVLGVNSVNTAGRGKLQRLQVSFIAHSVNPEITLNTITLHVINWALKTRCISAPGQSVTNNKATGMISLLQNSHSWHQIQHVWTCVCVCAMEVTQVSLHAFPCNVKRHWVLRGTPYKSHCGEA